MAPELPYHPSYFFSPQLRPTFNVEIHSVRWEGDKGKADATFFAISNSRVPVGLLDDLWPFLNWFFFSLLLDGQETFRKEMQGTNWDFPLKC